MYLSEIELKNFRNINSGNYKFHRGSNIITGCNGSGKTSILEAISLLATVTSFRKIGKTEFIKWGSKYCYLKSLLKKQNSITLELGFDFKRKMGKVDGVPCKRLIDFIGKMNLIIFLPQDLNIVTESPKLRRKLIDRITFNFQPDHIQSLQEYNKIRAKRNMILKDF